MRAGRRCCPYLPLPRPPRPRPGPGRPQPCRPPGPHPDPSARAPARLHSLGPARPRPPGRWRPMTGGRGAGPRRRPGAMRQERSKAARPPPRSPVSTAAARPPTAAAPVPGNRATRGRAVREGRKQGRGRPGRAAGVGAARIGGGAAATLSRFGPKNISTSRLQRPNAPSRSHENTQLPLPGPAGSPASRAPARPRTHRLVRRLALGSLTSWRYGALIGLAQRRARPLFLASRCSCPSRRRL